MGEIYASTAILAHARSLIDVLEQYNAAGFRAVELGSGHQDLPDLLEILNRYPFTYAVHNYFPLDDPQHLLNIASLDQNLRAKTLQVAKRAITLCHALKGNFYGIHAGFRSDVTAATLGKPLQFEEIYPYESAFQVMVSSVQELCDFAAPLGVSMLVENHVLAPFNLINGHNELLMLCESDEFLRLAGTVRRPNFGMLLDVGHLKVTSRTLGFDRSAYIDTLAGWIKCLHLSDNDGNSDQALPFDGDAWFAPLVRQMADTPAVIETQVSQTSQLVELIHLVEAWKQA